MNIVSLIGTFLITWLSLLLLKPVAIRVGLIDEPGERKIHSAPTPLVGGLGIYLGVLAITFFTPQVLEHYEELLTLSALVLFIGILDDFRELPARARMGGQALAALLMCLLAGNQLTTFGNLLGLGEVDLGAWAIPVTVFATVGVINAVNMSDGIDGLSGGLTLIALAFISVMAYQGGNATVLLFAWILIFSLLAFLALNYRLPWHRPAMIYLGDAGSTFLGFVLAWILIECTQGSQAMMPPVLALWFLAVPLMDTVWLLISRPLNGRSCFQPGKDHIHHLMLSRGLSLPTTVALLFLTGLALAAAGYLLHYAGASETLLFYLFMALFGLYCTIRSKMSTVR